MISIIHATLNNKKVAYHSQTRFRVQTLRKKRASWRTAGEYRGDLGAAIDHYNDLVQTMTPFYGPVAVRVYAESMNKPILALKKV